MWALSQRRGVDSAEWVQIDLRNNNSGSNINKQEHETPHVSSAKLNVPTREKEHVYPGNVLAYVLTVVPMGPCVPPGAIFARAAPRATVIAETMLADKALASTSADGTGAINWRARAARYCRRQVPKGRCSS